MRIFCISVSQIEKHPFVENMSRPTLDHHSKAVSTERPSVGLLTSAHQRPLIRDSNPGPYVSRKCLISIPLSIHQRQLMSKCNQSMILCSHLP